ncbi:hypothetical protein ACFOD9_06990 [Novosphingobium bradum]|uniref:UrcA family protein n=1 Tax=Novosphingobium bradum TaxID=1737444 RepID=A0ABV7IMS3_9SPHN
MHGTTLIRPLAIAAAFGAALLGAAPAQAAGFVNSRAEWMALSLEARGAYVQGLNDSLNYVFVDDSLINALAKAGRTKCLIERRITAAALVEGIDSDYRQEQFAGLAPAAIYILRMQEICRFHINQKRAEMGLGPM